MTDKHREAIFFASPGEFREWLEQYHERALELWVGFHKKSTGRPSLTWPESVDEALCFGWIDGIRKSVNAEAYVIRFTPRKPTSIWSNVNVTKAQLLIETGRMRPPGLRAFDARDSKKSGIYAFEQRASDTPDASHPARQERLTRRWFLATPLAFFYQAAAAT